MYSLNYLIVTMEFSISVEDPYQWSKLSKLLKYSNFLCNKSTVTMNEIYGFKAKLKFLYTTPTIRLLFYSLLAHVMA
jgi:hypothetical protein